MKADARALFFEGMNLGRDGETERAVRCFEAVVEAAPSHVEARYNLAAGLLELGRPDESLEQFHIILKERPEDPDILANIGRIHVRRAEAEEAREHLEKALANDPDNGNALCWMGVFRGKLENEYEKALELFRKSLEAGDDFPEAHVGVAVCHHHLGRLREAVGHLEKASGLAPHKPIILNHLGIVHMKLGMEQKAEEYFRAALRLDPAAKFRHASLWDI